MTKRFSGDLDKFTKKMQKATKDASGQISFDVLFNQGFMKSNSRFKAIDDMFNEEGIEVETKEEFEALDEQVLDKMVRKHTKFNSWEEMLIKAGEEYMGKEIKKRLR